MSERPLQLKIIFSFHQYQKQWEVGPGSCAVSIWEELEAELVTIAAGVKGFGWREEHMVSIWCAMLPSHGLTNYLGNLRWKSPEWYDSTTLHCLIPSGPPTAANASEAFGGKPPRAIISHFTSSSTWICDLNSSPSARFLWLPCQNWVPQWLTGNVLFIKGNYTPPFSIPTQMPSVFMKL